MTNEPQATSAAAWRAPHTEGVPITFPSGNVAYLRPMDFTIYDRLNYVPDVLLPVIQEALTNNGRATFVTEEELKAPEGKLKARRVMEAFAEVMFVAPVVRADPAEDELDPRYIDEFDLSFLMSLIGRPAEDLKSFRERQDTGLELVPPQSGDGQSTERPDADPPRRRAKNRAG